VELSEFETGFMLLRKAYGDRMFPPERESLMWRRYRHAAPGKFKEASEHVVLHMLTPGAVLSFLDGQVNGESNKPLVDSAWAHDQCRDLGFWFNGEKAERCTCERGKQLNPAELHRQQVLFDHGKELLRGKASSVLPDLPYDKNERGSA
jgi:hypothetical protein